MTITFHTAYFLNAMATQLSDSTPIDTQQCPHCIHVTTTNGTVKMCTSYELFLCYKLNATGSTQQLVSVQLMTHW